MIGVKYDAEASRANSVKVANLLDQAPVRTRRIAERRRCGRRALQHVDRAWPAEPLPHPCAGRCGKDAAVAVEQLHSVVLWRIVTGADLNAAAAAGRSNEDSHCGRR